MNVLDCCAVPLEGETLLHIVGPDAAKFLQGQATCDTRRLDLQRALPGACCTPQGRVVCDFLLSQAGPEHLVLRLRRDIATRSGATLGRYIVFSKAELRECGEWLLIGCWGAGSRATLSTLFAELPTGRYAAAATEDTVVIQVDEGGSRFECYLRGDRGGALAAALLQACTPGSEDDWRVAQIDSGIGRVEEATIEAFLPQMLNYDLTGHVAFDKGCYTGQEVVARLHYRGTPKRRSYRLHLADTPPPAAGSPLFVAGETQSVGNVVNSAPVGSASVALAVLSVSRVGDDIRLGSPDGPRVAVRPTPYDLQRG